MNKKKYLIITSGILGFLAVALGAFGAHILKEKIPSEYLSVFQTGVLYHLVHSVGVLVIAISSKENFYKAAIFFTAGIILFSFSLYIYSVTQVKAFAMITPIGGVIFLIGWLLIVIEGIKLKS
jgi:uncharacterized membrane protein YgdD (TMEM256/DUF423 family)